MNTQRGWITDRVSVRDSERKVGYLDFVQGLGVFMEVGGLVHVSSHPGTG